MTRLRAVMLTAALLVGACGEDDPAPATLDDGTGRPAAPEAAGASPGCGDGADVAPGTTTEASVDTAEGERDFLLSVPPGYDGETPAALMLSFHGLGSAAQQQLDYTGLVERADEAGAVVASPEGGGIPSRWRLPGNDGAADDVAFVESLLDHLGDRLCIDEGRTFSVGVSNGAAFSAVLGCELRHRIAGVGAVAGVNLVAPCPTDDPMPLLAFHGTDDDIVPFDGGSVLAGLAEAQPVIETVAGWADRNGCDPDPVEHSAGEVRRLHWEGCAEDGQVELYVVEGGGHTWPGARHVIGLGHVTDQIDASTLILEFFGLS